MPYIYPHMSSGTDLEAEQNIHAMLESKDKGRIVFLILPMPQAVQFVIIVSLLNISAQFALIGGRGSLMW